MRLTCDIAIIGAGFGGSLAALAFNRLGLRCVLLDRGRHPRYAIGESSTPVADLVLRDLTKNYDLPRLAPLAKYGSWRTAYPDLTCGLKRGFSYFKQVAGERFAAQPDHANELLVAASTEDALADTHWFRPEVDQFLAEEAQAAGIPYFDNTVLTVREREPRWLLDGVREGREFQIEAEFILDASGDGQFLPRHLNLGSRVESLRTNSWTVFGHFKGVRRWRDLLLASGGHVAEHPFDCDAAAQHQVIDEGWMWQLRFDNGVTSAGFMLDGDWRSPDSDLSPQAEWDALMARYPSLWEQFAGARRVLPVEGLRKTRRVQRLADAGVGANWALLPYTFGFIDALHSTGIAQTLCAIERLAGAFAAHWGRDSLANELRRYERTLFEEIALIDDLVSGCYLARRDFALFAAFTMLYFAATSTYERRRLKGELQPGAAFLCADDVAWREAVRKVHRHWREISSNGETDDFLAFVADAIAPFNTAGLCDPRTKNMYRHTVLPG